MKISQNWLKDYLVFDKTPQELDIILTSTGLEVDGWEIVKPSAADLDKVLVGQVLSCEKIPDTDHLSATTVETGDGQIRSIVCGAPNVAAGQKVFVAIPGAQVFSKDGSLFQIAERKVRGISSQGMICAQDEIGVGHDHSGIMVLAADTRLGMTAAEYFQQMPDTIFEIGLTPNRADATNHIGVARDLAAYLRVREKMAAPLNLPDTKAFSAVNKAKIEVLVENLEACPRFCGVSISGLKITDSPDWLKNRLTAVGIRPINNVVDVTNYVRAECGQPLHAYDARAIAGQKILVKTLPENTIFKTLDETERKLFAEDLMVCDGDSKPMCMGGVFGGADCGVNDSTTEIFLEAAFFSAKGIRRSMIRHNLRTDAAWTFEKGVNPNGTLEALKRAALLICELAGGEIASDLTDIYPTEIAPARIAVKYRNINQLIGQNLSKKTVAEILGALEIEMTDESNSGFTAVVPTNKPDVTREADVVEEILRIYGLDTVPLPTQIRSSIEITPKPNPDQIRNRAADFLAAAGFNECMSLALSNSELYSEMPDLSTENLVFVHNTANQGLDCMRPTLLFSGLDAIRHNQNRQNSDLQLFEFGNTYRREGDKFKEKYRLALFLTGERFAENWQNAGNSKKETDFYTLKAQVNNLLQRLGISGFQETVVQEYPFQSALKLHRGTQTLVIFGKLQVGVCKKADIKNAVFYADFDWENLLKSLKNKQIQFSELNRFPSVRRDLALVLNSSITFAEVSTIASQIAKKLLKNVQLFDVFEDENKLGAGKKSYAVSFVFENPEKTLQEKEIEQVMTSLQNNFESKLKAVIRK